MVVLGPFDEGALTIEERFTEKGRARQDLIWKTYVQRNGVTAPLFDSQGGSFFSHLFTSWSYDIWLAIY